MKKWYIATGVLAILISLCAVFLAIQPQFFPLDETAKQTEVTVLPQVDSSTAPPSDSYECPEKLIEAMDISPDVYAWISVPGTNIDYPLVQSSDNDAYYLKRGWDGKFLSAGAIMTEHTYNSKTFEDPATVIYGHNMKSGAMFGRLQKVYSKQKNLTEYNVIEIYLPDKKLEYSIFAAVPYDNRHILKNYDFGRPKMFAAFFDSITSQRAFNINMLEENRAQYGDKLLILSTCLKGNGSKRYLVIAKLVTA